MSIDEKALDVARQAWIKEWELWDDSDPGMPMRVTVACIEAYEAAKEQPATGQHIVQTQPIPEAVLNYSSSGNDQPVELSKIERLLNEYEVECIRYGASDYGNTDKLQAARKIVMNCITDATKRESGVLSERDAEMAREIMIGAFAKSTGGFSKKGVAAALSALLEYFDIRRRGSDE